MKILYIGESKTHELYTQGVVPSHWLYGAVEMEKDGHEVIWCKESSSFLNDMHCVCTSHPDLIFIPNFNIKSHLLLLFLSLCWIVRIPIYAYLHHAPKKGEGLKSFLYKLFLCRIKHIFFLSELSMQETIERGFAKKENCSVPGWGADRNFYERVKTSDRGYFVSTGKENRDFDILIEAFKRTGAPLKIMTAKSHAGSNYSDLAEKCKGIPNIEVVVTENSSDVYPLMLDAMAKAKAIVCPLRQDRLDYCVGLSTIADAEGLRKPLLITENPYHSPSRMSHFNVVNSVNDWMEAIANIKEYSQSLYSMQSAYENMKKQMNL